MSKNYYALVILGRMLDEARDQVSKMYGFCDILMGTEDFTAKIDHIDMEIQLVRSEIETCILSEKLQKEES